MTELIITANADNTAWTDQFGNRATLAYWGDRERAEASLATLKNCSDCSDCSDCYDCYDCSDCSDCSDCYDCSRCSRCSDCYDCYDCSRCSGCSDCYDCYDCLRCSGCSRCSDCSDCSRCLGCSGCSDCLRLACLVGRQHVTGKPDAAPYNGRPPIPTIAGIHGAVYTAASQPNALDMRDWHTCGTTHCRAGWVVHLAGEAGYALERFHNTELAAQLIYRESDPANPVAPTRFYETNEDALADMKRLAEIEAATSAAASTKQDRT